MQQELISKITNEKKDQALGSIHIRMCQSRNDRATIWNSISCISWISKQAGTNSHEISRMHLPSFLCVHGTTTFFHNAVAKTTSSYTKLGKHLSVVEFLFKPFFDILHLSLNMQIRLRDTCFLNDKSIVYFIIWPQNIFLRPLIF